MKRKRFFKLIISVIMLLSFSLGAWTENKAQLLHKVNHLDQTYAPVTEFFEYKWEQFNDILSTVKIATALGYVIISPELNNWARGP